MSLGLPIVPSKKYGDLEKVRELTEQRDRLAEAIRKHKETLQSLTPNAKSAATGRERNENE